MSLKHLHGTTNPSLGVLDTCCLSMPTFLPPSVFKREKTLLCFQKDTKGNVCKHVKKVVWVGPCDAAYHCPNKQGCFSRGLFKLDSAISQNMCHTSRNKMWSRTAVRNVLSTLLYLILSQRSHFALRFFGCKGFCVVQVRSALRTPTPSDGPLGSLTRLVWRKQSVSEGKIFRNF